MVETPSLHLPACLIIMDGYGISEPGPTNAISQAKTPCLDYVFSEHPWVQLNASGTAVGLPEGQMGNSEVGHLNIGAGRIVYQELTRINQACEDGSLAENPTLNKVYEAAKNPDTVLHLMGLLSDGGVHSSNQHLYALLRLACTLEVPQVRVHCFMDGRDVPPSSGEAYLEELEEVIAELNNDVTHIAIGSIAGRYYAMDRDNRWDRVEKAYNAMTCADPLSGKEPRSFIQESYCNGVTDEFITPTSFDERGVLDGDSIVFFNFRPDRAREISRAFVDVDFTSFRRSDFLNIHFLCLTEYDPDLAAPVAFSKEFPAQVLADVLSQAGLRQYHIAETEKYAHMTFFLNGGKEEPKQGEQRELIPSPQVATYDLQPEMSGPKVAHTLVQAIKSDEADVYLVNFANCDMVGHTGDITAAIQAVEAVDAGVAQVLGAMEEKRGIVLLTADHGNADKMFDTEGQSFTAHTTAPVPFALIDYSGGGASLKRDVDAAICNIAPTLLEALGLSIPNEMNAASLLAK